MTPLELLGLEVLEARGSGAVVHEVPAWLGDPQMVGALARLPAPARRVSASMLRARARRLLTTHSDRGWGGLVEALTRPDLAPSGSYWLRLRRSAWPPALLRWSEERVKALTFFLQTGSVKDPACAVALFETVETHEELTLARWLTGRTWAKGARMIEVMEAARLNIDSLPRHTSELWHQLVKDKRLWLRSEHIDEIDESVERSGWAWFGALERERRSYT